MAYRRHPGSVLPRRQFAALPIIDGDNGVRVMLVTSRGTGRWVLPKGWPKKHLSGPETAALEAFEEAGLVGEVASVAVGAFCYAKRMPNGDMVECAVEVFRLQVAELLDDWPERGQRRRAWFTPAEAAGRVDEAGLTEILLRLAEG